MVYAADATTLTRQEVEMAGLFSKHLEYCTGPSVSTKKRSLSVFFRSTFLSSEYTSGGPYDTYSPLSIDFANCFLLPANQCNNALLILYDGSISKMASSILLERIDTGLLVNSASSSIAPKTCSCRLIGTSYVLSRPISPTPSIDCKLDLKISLNLSRSSLPEASGCIPINCLTTLRCVLNRSKPLIVVSTSTVTEHAIIFILSRLDTI